MNGYECVLAVYYTSFMSVHELAGSGHDDDIVSLATMGRSPGSTGTLPGAGGVLDLPYMSTRPG